MKNVKEVIELIKEDHEQLEKGDLSVQKAKVKCSNYRTVRQMYADKLSHDKHYGINDKIDFYAK